MRRNKDGTIHAHSKNAQDFVVQTAGAQDARLNLTRAYLGDLNYLSQRCRDNEALPVVTARAALKLLVEYLERNR